MKAQLKFTLLAIAASLLIFTGCEKGDLPHGAKKKVSGIGYFDEVGKCNSAKQGADFALRMTGDLEGCLYVFIDEFSCQDGNYIEKGTELFIGRYKGKSGSFRTTYDAQATYEGCTPEGSYAGAQLWGQCQHYIVKGSGTGDFKGVTGRIDFADRVTAVPVDYPYEGHLKF